MRVELPQRGLHLEYERHGDPAARPLIMVMGLGMQLVAWPAALIEGLVAAGYQPIVFDNRDIGLSGCGPLAPTDSMGHSMLRYLTHRPVRAAFTLDDMALDTLALADALELKRFDLMGVSLGGMVAQKIAFRAPARVRSLVSFMSSAGPRAAPWSKLSVLPKFLSRPPKSAPVEVQIEHFAGLFEVIGCLTDEAEKAAMRVRLKAALQRAYRPTGTARQLLAVLADPDRSAEVAQINCPTTLIHGEDDPLVRIAAMEHMQRLLPEATAHRIPGLGHYMPGWVVPTLVEQVTGHLRRS